MSDFTLIYGCMFSGKTTRLIELYNNSTCLDGEKLAVKPLLDQRYSPTKINSHGGLFLPGHRISKADELFPICSDNVKEVYIDEVQFLGNNVHSVILGLMIQGIKVVSSGLDLDYLGQPFGPMPALIKIAREKIQLSAKCHVCGAPAQYTYRNVSSDELILVGHTDMYEARCRQHWEEGMGRPLPHV